MSNSIYPLIVVAGPTAAGKSALALELAQTFDGEIVNGDSLQIYRGMDIGTAKPTAEERLGVPHHLFDVRNPDEVFTAGEYSRLARVILREIAERRKVPFIVGGAGFYIRALLEGLAPIPTRSEELRARLVAIENRRAGSLYRLLRCWDSTAAQRIHANDTNKLVRALEVIWQTDTKLSKIHEAASQKLEGYRVLIVGLAPPREALRARIALRAERMFQTGLLDEVVRLREAGFGASAKAMESVGYRQAHAVLEGLMTVPAAIEETTLRSRQYAKRQLTWFRKTNETSWLSGFGDDPSVQAQAKSLLKQFLTGCIENPCR